MFRKLLCLLCILGLSLSAQARVITETSTQTSQGEGIGLTREEAVSKAIIEALSKIQGVQINAIKSSSIAMASTSQQGTQVTDIYSEDISKITKGRVDSYDIDSVFQDADGRYVAQVTIYKTKTTKRYQAPGMSADSRRNLTVLGTAQQDAGRFNEVFEQQLINEFVQSRKFNVLDRQHQSLYAMEKAFIRSGNALSDEVYKLGNALGTDYMFVYSLRSAQAQAEKSNLTGRERYQGQLWIDYQVVLFATRQIKFSGTYSNNVNFKDGSPKAVAAALEQVAAQMVDEVLEAIYPLRVADVVKGEAVFSQELSDGQVYHCYAEGDMIRDAYTKENTGRVENKVGSVEVVRHTSKLSYAKIIEGVVNKNNVCRKAGSSFGSDVGRDADYQLLEGGGVKLGF